MRSPLPVFFCYIASVSIAGVPRALSQCVAQLKVDQLPRVYSGQYRNPAYGFSVFIPQGFVGRDVDNPLYQRGFIVLFPNPEERISAYADVNSLEWRSPKEAADALAGIDSKEGLNFVSRHGVAMAFNGHSAFRTTIDYTCGHDRQSRYSSVLVVALSNDKRFYYILSWEGSRTHSKAGEKTLQLFVDSWRFSKPTS
jgi:hypothetical protein